MQHEHYRPRTQALVRVRPISPAAGLGNDLGLRVRLDLIGFELPASTKGIEHVHVEPVHRIQVACRGELAELGETVFILSVGEIL